MHLPMVFLDGPWRMAMGLNRLDLADWIWFGPTAEAELAEKRRLLTADVDAVLRTLPEAVPAARELLAALIENLTQHHADRFLPCDGGLLVRATGATVRADDADPLRAAGLLVQEDLCLLAPGEAGYRLVAASLSFPMRWRLADKLGAPLRAIHAPVPGFADRLGGPADRFFATLEPERPVWRANWSIADDPSLHQPDTRGKAVVLDAADAGDRLWLRVERQTLRRLDESRHVVFTIHTLVRPLAEVAALPGVAAGIAARLAEMPEPMLRYKNLLALKAPLLAWLERRPGQGPQHQTEAAA